MKKLIIRMSVLLSVITFTSIQAQNRVTPTENKQAGPAKNAYDGRLKAITDACGLTADQQAKVKTILSNYGNGHAENIKKYPKGSEELKNADKANNDTYQSQMKATLSPEQWKKLQELDNNKKK